MHIYDIYINILYHPKSNAPYIMKHLNFKYMGLLLEQNEIDGRQKIGVAATLTK